MTEAANIAADLKKDGQAMTLTRTTAGAFDPITGTMTGGVTQTWTVYGRRSNFSSLARYGAGNTQPGTMILGGDRLFIISADQVAPIPGDVITDKDSVDWTVMRFDAVDGEDNDAVLYKVHVRR